MISMRLPALCIVLKIRFLPVPVPTSVPRRPLPAAAATSPLCPHRPLPPPASAPTSAPRRLPRRRPHVPPLWERGGQGEFPEAGSGGRSWSHPPNPLQLPLRRRGRAGGGGGPEKGEGWRRRPRYGGVSSRLRASTASLMRARTLWMVERTSSLVKRITRMPRLSSSAVRFASRFCCSSSRW